MSRYINSFISNHSSTIFYKNNFLFDLAIISIITQVIIEILAPSLAKNGIISHYTCNHLQWGEVAGQFFEIAAIIRLRLMNFGEYYPQLRLREYSPGSLHLWRIIVHCFVYWKQSKHGKVHHIIPKFWACSVVVCCTTIVNRCVLQDIITLCQRDTVGFPSLKVKRI